MSIPLKDFRCGLPEEIDIWLDAEATASGRDKADIVREILLDWAKRRAHAHRIASARIKSQRIKLEEPGAESSE